MSYRNHYSGSPWQQGGPPFGVGNYGQNYYNDQYQMMNAGYGRNQGYGGGMYGSGGMNQMRSMGYGGPTQSRHYGGDRMGGGNRQIMSRGQMQRKRLPQRSPVGGPRSKRPNLGDSRRMSKPRRRRDSRGGSKGRRDRSDDDEDAYNPAEPTDDASDVECMDGYVSLKSSGDEGDEEKKAVKENGEQESEGTGEGEKKDDKPPKRVICYVCKVKCPSEEKYKKHQSSALHTSKIEELLVIRRGKKSEDDKAGSDKEGRDGRRRSRKPSNWCTVCECVFNGNFLAHRRTKEHRKKRDKKYPKCRPCRLGFSSSEEFRDHYKSEDHKQKSAEFHYLKGLASGSDEDEAAIKPIKIEEEETKMEEAPAEETAKEKAAEDEADVKPEIKTEEEGATEGEAGEKEKDKEKKEGKKESEKEKEKKKPREPRPSGQSFVVSVQGYYCKLCRKYFKDVVVAKSKHCRSIMHVTAFKQAMEEALVQEEERQKLADEQDKIDREAAEAAELAADIAAIERSARETAKREIAKKKAEASKSQDVEMKETAETKKEEGKSEEKMETAATTTEQTAENGVKQEAEAEAEEVPKVEEKVAAVKAEPQDESLDADDDVDDEQEKTKEITSSGGKRGRGRGRGRKRR